MTVKELKKYLNTLNDNDKLYFNIGHYTGANEVGEIKKENLIIKKEG